MMRRFHTLLPLLIGLLLPTIAWAEDDITINASNFPDKAFRDYLTSQYYGEDGVLTEEEIAVIFQLDITNKGIKSLKGIEHFTNLYVLQCDSNQLSSLDVSKNTSLTGLDCSNNKLTKLDVSQNTGLEWLNCSNNKLSTLDVTKNTELLSLECMINQLKSLDVTQNTALYYLHCRANQLSSLDVTQNTALYYLDCEGTQLTNLDVSNNTGLQYLNCGWNKLASLDISQNTVLQYLGCYHNQLASLDVSQNTALVDFDCFNNQLTSLDVSNNTKLQYLNCSNNQLTSLDVSSNTLLTELYCGANMLRGQAMDDLIASLPIVDAANIYVKYYNSDGNECLSAQIAAIKAKGWTPYFNGVIGNTYQWLQMDEYETSRKNIYTQTIDDVTYILWHEMTDKYTINSNPEPTGGWFYKSNFVLDVEKDGTTESYLLDDQFFTGEEMDPAYVPSMLFDMDARKMYVFCTSKDGYHDYGMEGFIYESSLDDLQFTKKTVFNRANMGWYSGFMGLRDGRPVVTHWSFAGYIAMVSTCSAKGVWTSTKEQYLPGHDDYIPIWEQQRHVLIVGNDYDWVTESQYQAALEDIPTRSTFRIYTMFDSKKYYLTAYGTLTESVDKAKDFVFTQVKSNTLYASPGWKLNIPFTNPLMSMSNGASGELLNTGGIRTNPQRRNNWEGQVWYKKGDCYAVRATNALSVTYGANTFWGLIDNNGDGQPEAGYSLEPTFIWQLEEVNNENGIENMVSDTSDGNIIYNLAGQRQTTLQKGLNIVGHKKIMIR